jgi:hypothetical protein
MMTTIAEKIKLKSLLLVIMIVSLGWIGIISYIILTYDLLDTWDNMLCYPAVDILVDNVDNIDDLNIYCESDVGSYLIANGGHPYIDCRAEVYDIALNNNKDILYEYHLLLWGIYKGELINDVTIVNKFQADYDFDYYIITETNSSNNNTHYLYDIIRDTAYCNYKNDYFGIYSYKHALNFAN